MAGGSRFPKPEKHTAEIRKPQRGVLTWISWRDGFQFRMRHLRLQQFLILVSLLGVGGWLLSWGWSEVRAAERLDQSAAVVEGRVVSGHTQALSKGGQAYSLVVAYQPANHPEITKTFDMDGPTYRAALASGTVKVTYVPEEPQISRITKWALFPFQLLMGLGGLMLLGGIVVLALKQPPSASET